MTDDTTKTLVGKSTTPLILASASAARGALLEGAGLRFSKQPAAVDEDAAKEDLRERDASAEEAATALAELKAMRISRQMPEAFVIGAAQLLECEGQWFE